MLRFQTGRSIADLRVDVRKRVQVIGKATLEESRLVNWVPAVDFDSICEFPSILKLEQTPFYHLLGGRAPPDAPEELHRNRIRPLNLGVDERFEGCNSIVFKAFMEKPAMQIVIKGCLPLDSRAGYDPMLEEQALEARILSSLPDHPNLVPILHSFSGSSALVYPWVPAVYHDLARQQRLLRHQTSYFIFPFYERTLKSKYAGSAIPEREVFLDVFQVANALQHLAGNGVSHCDIKSDNVFVSENGLVLLGDFGCARRLVFASGAPMGLVQNSQLVTPAPGNAAARPPEFAMMYRKLGAGEPDSQFDTVEKMFAKYDIFGAGVMFAELLSGQSGPVEASLARCAEAYSADLVDLLRSMVNADVEHRCSAADLVERVSALLWPPPRGLASAESVEEWLCQQWMGYLMDGRVKRPDGSVLDGAEVHMFVWHSLQLDPASLVEEAATATGDGRAESKLAVEESKLPDGVALIDTGAGFELVLPGKDPIGFSKSETGLVWGDNQIGDEGAEALSRALPSLTGLRRLYLYNNRIGAEGAEALSRALPSLRGLKRLDLDNNQIGDEGAEALSRALPSLRGLKGLDLHNNQIGDGGAEALSRALPSLTGLKRLDLENNRIGDGGAEALSRALPSLTGLKYLNLGENQIGAEGAEALSRALPSLRGLKRLDLDKNRIGDEGAEALSRALPSLTGLKWLYLDNIQIGDGGAEALSRALPSLRGLKRLYLYNNQIGDEGAEALSRALPSLTGLERLDLQDNSLSDAMKDRVRSATREGCTIYL